MLPSLGAQLRAVFSAGSLPSNRLKPTVVAFDASRALLESCTVLCQAVGVSPEALLNHCRAAQLLHICGAECSAQVAAHEGLFSDVHLENAMVQLHAFAHTIRLVRSLRLAGQLPSDPAAIALAFPPVVVLPWLANIGEVLLGALERSPGGRCAVAFRVLFDWVHKRFDSTARPLFMSPLAQALCRC